MFRWCAYCQRFIGESAPLDNYAVTHGVCAACTETVLGGTFQSTPTALIAQQLFHAITESTTRGEFALPETLFQQAIDAKIRPSDLLLGVLQPALYRIGLQWEQGEVTPALERAFSTWCRNILSRFTEEFAHVASPTILLTPLVTNSHDLGIAFLARFLRDNRVSCLLIAPGLPDAALVEKCLQVRPAFCGLSVSLPTHISRAVALAKRIESETHGDTTVILGGLAFRQGALVDYGIPVLQDASALLRFLRAA